MPVKPVISAVFEGNLTKNIGLERYWNIGDFICFGYETLDISKLIGDIAGSVEKIQEMEQH